MQRIRRSALRVSGLLLITAVHSDQVTRADIVVSLTADGGGRFYDYFSNAYAQINRSPDGMYDIDSDALFNSGVDGFPTESNWADVGTLTLSAEITGQGSETISIIDAGFDFDPYVSGSSLSVAGGNYATALSSVAGSVTLLDGVVQSMTFSADIGFTFSGAADSYDGTLTMSASSFELSVDDTVLVQLPSPFPQVEARQEWDFEGTPTFAPEISAPPTPIVPVTPSITFSEGDAVVQFSSVAGNFYQVKWTSELAGAGAIPTWANLGGLITGDGSAKQVVDPDSSEEDQRFYAIVISN
ncbi:MAG: hypothetical protein AAF065_10570 [Verrucomicrobiota bacterium]